MGKLREIGGESFLPTADIYGPEGNVCVQIDSQDVFEPAESRLGTIMDVARQIEIGVPTRSVAMQILATDGWSFTEFTVRTPTWLRDVQEWTFMELGAMHREFS